MSIEQIFLLALVQGISEFLPISSSAHLILVPTLTGWKDQGLVADVMVHIGSLFAILTYFRKDAAQLVQGGISLARGQKTPHGRLVLLLALATIPALAVGATLKLAFPESPWRNTEIIAWNSAIFAIILYASDRFGAMGKKIPDLGGKAVFLIGCAQAIALIPGVSRSGVTISAARAMGIERREAARFSFLLAIPAISAAGALTAFDAWRAGAGIPIDALWAAFFSFFSALAAIGILMNLLKRTGFAIFALYRLALSFFLFAMIYDWFPSLLPSLPS